MRACTSSEPRHQGVVQKGRSSTSSRVYPHASSGEVVDLAEVALEIHDSGEDPRLVEDRLELRGRRQQLVFGLLPGRDVADDLGRPDDLAARCLIGEIDNETSSRRPSLVRRTVS